MERYPGNTLIFVRPCFKCRLGKYYHDLYHKPGAGKIFLKGPGGKHFGYCGPYILLRYSTMTL